MPAGLDLDQLGIHVVLELHVARVVPVVRMESRPLPRDVRGHAGPGCRQAVHVAGPRPALPVRSSAWVRVPVDEGIEWIEAITEQPGRPTGDERVLSRPARPVHRVVRVDVDEPAVAVGRSAEARGAESANTSTLVRVAAEDALEAAVVDPALVDLELREGPGPV